MRSFAFAVPALVALVVGCTVSTTNNPSPIDNTSADAGTTTPEAAAPTPASVPFKMSNLSLAGIDASKLGDFVVSSANCSFHTEMKEVSCGNNDALAYVTIDQPGGGKIGMYVAKSIRVEPNAGIVTKGTYALAIVALDTMDIQGTIDVSAKSDYPSAGGFVHPTSDNAKGGGVGGGGAGSASNGGAGGSYCGVGGKGAALVSGGTASTGGTTYGTAENIPLVGGSAGGSAALPGSGTGGGAVQLVAGKSFTLGATGIIAAGGGGGTFVGAASSQHGAGGGAGGAVLIEAPAVSLLGSVLAEGGAGGAKQYGQDAPLTGAQAASDTLTNGSLGGHGSGNTDLNGGDSTSLTGDNAPGGGGGAGRIRVNSTTGNSALGALKLSPSANDKCMTEGILIGL